ncbi:immunity 49 family protein [Nocardia sp. 2YAB30]|uniref:immunity 49 family protein n=1 Tax=Nocardia sp. 2YAB30 TaxID=3233022 RepID=UPI003F98B772
MAGTGPADSESAYAHVLPLTQRDEALFNDSLAVASDLHRSFWTRDDERNNDPRGFIALGPLAIACWARDTGISVEVESEYLPEHFLQGTWVGENPI